jgi:dihydroneopterin aldolase
MATLNPTSDPAPSRDPGSERAHPARGTQPDRIVVNGLVVDASVGVHDFEHDARQRVRFDVEIDTVDDYAHRVRTTGAYVSYADVVEYIEARASSMEHVELVETWAEDVAAFALRNELAQSVRVTVQKLDIFAAAEGVGVAIERHRAASDGEPRS